MDDGGQFPFSKLLLSGIIVMYLNILHFPQSLMFAGQFFKISNSVLAELLLNCIHSKENTYTKI